MPYIVIVAYTQSQIESVVNKYLEKGFKCQGGISITAIPLGYNPVPGENWRFIYAQAMAGDEGRNAESNS